MKQCILYLVLNSYHTAPYGTVDPRWLDTADRTGPEALPESDDSLHHLSQDTPPQDLDQTQHWEGESADTHNSFESPQFIFEPRSPETQHIAPELPSDLSISGQDTSSANQSSDSTSQSFPCDRCDRVFDKRHLLKNQQNERNPNSAVSGESRSDSIIINTSNPSFGSRNTTAEARPCGSSNFQSNASTPRQGYRNSSTSSDSKVVYYGDSFNLDYMLHEMGDPLGASRNGRTWEDALEHLYFSQLGQSTKTQIEEHSRNQRLQLRDIGALKSFEKNVSDDLIRIFFEMCYPQCPIFDRADFQHNYEAGRVSPLVLQAVFFLALNHCSEELYKRAGFANRYLATFTCYQRAKTLYDTNYESDAIATLQAVYLLSFWWGSPMEQKDMWHWTGIACNRAQSLGLHQRLVIYG
ncbi:unnamed protein product [Aspergillus oryzae]|uniref:Unnamed protein product n=2 Tax=Aspergillus oryzae TaxID=5062 RepID=A0AAN4YMR9_ASPOZ|nr:unnamed protein product [Aspergillus oryzae]GMF89619.1 unnamed protein product [Aspergillus oryzae]GMG30141.1 unnamed protein product [Aspergillus oryzae]GMG50201.1 unnamed protein product [Aspergillus oryzae var. brunneus]